MALSRVMLTLLLEQVQLLSEEKKFISFEFETPGERKSGMVIGVMGNDPDG